jgi:hypothetical protein
MAVETAHDLPITDKPAGDDTQSDSGVERYPDNLFFTNHSRYQNIR